MKVARCIEKNQELACTLLLKCAPEPLLTINALLRQVGEQSVSNRFYPRFYPNFALPLKGFRAGYGSCRYEPRLETEEEAAAGYKVAMV